jgi:predicted transglutaminase-like cysteine proteinase
MTAARRRQIEAVVARAAAEIATRSDRELHGRRDHWALPVWVRKILSPGVVLAGDCEDVALWIRRELVALGWPAGALRLCYCRIPEGHVVLIAQTDAGDYALSKGRARPWAEERWIYVSLECWPYWQMILPPP